MQNKRLFICTTGGLIAGLICSAGGHLSGNIQELTFFALAPAFFNRVMLGFIIGISNLRMNYLFHGALIGLWCYRFHILHNCRYYLWPFNRIVCHKSI